MKTIKPDNINFMTLMYKGMPVIQDETASSVTLYVKQSNERQLDMRYKSNKEFAKLLRKPWYDRHLQRLAEWLGSPIIFGDSHITWRLWLSPLWQFQQWRLRRSL